MTEHFPTDWQTAVVFVAHPDDPEYGMGAAVSRWTREGRTVEYVLATSGEAGIEGMSHEEAGPLREEEQRRAAAHVGVDVVDFLGFADSKLVNDDDLRTALIREIEARRPDVVITLYTGERFSPEIPNQSDHIELGNAVFDAVAKAAHKPELVFESGPGATHFVDVTPDDVERAVASLAEHKVYLEVLDPQTPVEVQARAVVEAGTGVADGTLRVGFIDRTWTPEPDGQQVNS